MDGGNETVGHGRNTNALPLAVGSRPRVVLEVFRAEGNSILIRIRITTILAGIPAVTIFPNLKISVSV